MKKLLETPGAIATDELTRRTFLKLATLFVGAGVPLASWTVGCGPADTSDGTPVPPETNGDAATLSPDAQVMDPAGPADAGTTFKCPANTVCLALSASANAPLRSTGGAVIIQQAPNGDAIIVVRTSNTTFAALSDYCTHEGCQMSYRPTQKDIYCGCHGSSFSTSGTVNFGPARRSLAVYKAALSSDGKYVLVTL